MLQLVAQASDSSGWNVTTSIAAAAAVISLVNLVVTTWASGRRERAKWAREALAEAFYEFIDASFRTRDRAQDLQRLLWRHGTDDSVISARGQLREQRTALRHAQTKIRLLAPDATTSRAQDLRDHFKRFSAALRSDMPEAEWDRWTDEIKNKRELLIAQAKRTMSLPR